MSISEHFYHGSTRKIIVAFGTLFNNIVVQREEDKQIKVPLTYASKSKFYLSLKQNADLGKKSNLLLPRMGFIITGIDYDSNRKQSNLAEFHTYTSTYHKNKVFVPVPYNIQVQLSIYTQIMNDGLQILEQIIPFFKPVFNISINELDEIGIIRDIPIILESISHDDTAEGTLIDGVRLLQWDLDFTIKANYYGPIHDQNVIETVYVDFHVKSDNETDEKIDERIKDKVIKNEDIWEFTEEIISAHDSDNIEIDSPEDNILKDKYSGFLRFSDSTEVTIL